MRRLRLGRFPYLNCLPLFLGLEMELREQGIEFLDAPPALQARALNEGQVDCALVSSAALPQLPAIQRLPAPVIASTGPVDSVIFFSPVPFSELKGRRIYCTEESRTARALLLVFLRQAGIEPEGVLPLAGQHRRPGFTEPLLLIGDEALDFPARNSFAWRADLGEIWTRTTDLPMVWGVFVLRRHMAAESRRLCESLAERLTTNAEHLLHFERDRLIREAQTRSCLDPERLAAYFARFRYRPAQADEAGLKSFLSLLTLNPASSEPCRR